jgi:hypothetical protein
MSPNQLDDALRQLALESIPIRIRGQCMSPPLRAGSLVRVRRQRGYWPGDILVYRNREGILLAHRLLGYYRRQGRWRLLIQADSARRPDAGAHLEQVLGKALGVRVPWWQRLRAVGRYLSFALAQGRLTGSCR